MTPTHPKTRMIGQSIAHYDVVAELGAGGMGVVYRARDTRLGREVAIKALPAEFAADERRLSRFENEARILASLSHPHIGAIYGLERADDQSFLILELVEGDTLAEIIARGRLPQSDALGLAIQIAEALATAHDAGVVHRDLKPSNIKVDPLGQLKILDFGLAKATVPAAQPIGTSDAPTETDLATAVGTILGTAPYMSPEQARGQEIDERTDIWAFGCVLFEMLTGRRTFGGPTRSDVTAAVLRREPDWDELPAGDSPRLRELLSWCLAKEPHRRLRSMGDALLLLRSISEESGRVETEAAGRAAGSRWRLPVASGIALALGLAAGFFGSGLFERPAAPQMMSIPMAPPHGLKPSLAYGPSLAISPDGTHLAFVLETGTTTTLYLKGPEDLEARPLQGTNGARTPFFSPTGEWIAFFDERDRKLKKISVGGGEPVPLVDADTAWGGDWGVDGSIVFTSDQGGIARIPATGGEPVRLAASGAWPELLPGGKVVLFTIRDGKGSYDEAKIVAMPLDGGEEQIKVILEAAYYPHYSPTGHLIFVQGHSILAAPFDPEALEVTGPAVTVLEQVWTSSWTGYSDFAFSESGNLVYISGGPNPSRARLVVVDRDGNREAVLDQRRPYRVPRWSPDGKQLAVAITDEQVDIWTFDLNRESLSRLTDSASWEAYPQWRPGGGSIAFASMRTGPAAIYLRDLRRGTDERLFESENPNYPSSWSPDGTLLAYTEANPESGNDILIYSLISNSSEAFLSTSHSESHAEFSPDGRYVAYESDETGRQSEIYIRPYPEANPRLQVSTHGGRIPRWSAAGTEIFYWVGGSLMAVPITFGVELTAGTPTKLLEGAYGYSYDVTPDGRSFLLLEEMDNSDPPMRFNFVANWFAQLKLSSPSKG